MDGYFTWSRPKEDAGSRTDETSEMKQADRNGENETLDDHSPTTVWTLTDLNLRMKPVSTYYDIVFHSRCMCY